MTSPFPSAEGARVVTESGARSPKPPTIGVPWSVIRQRMRRVGTYGGRPWRRVRAQVLAASPYCVVCGGSATTVDHIVPRSEGGLDEITNCRPLCKVDHDRISAQAAARRRWRVVPTRPTPVSTMVRTTW